jgi:hypothetical protein
VSWGPLSVSDNSVLGSNGRYGGGALFGNYALTTSSPVIDYIPCSNFGASHCTIVVPAGSGLPAITLPTSDFFGNQRPDNVGPAADRHCTNGSVTPPPGKACVDVGAVESHQ